MTVKIPADKTYVYNRIVACTVCKSTGTRQCSEVTNYHRNEYDDWLDLCSTCGGDGRLVMVVCETQIELDLPNGKKHYHRVQSEYTEPLNSRTTQDIYRIGRT